MAFQFLVRNLMTSEVKTLSDHHDLSIANDLMSMERIRHMPVISDDGEVIGVVTQRDLFRGALAAALGYGEHAQRKLLESLKVKDVMHADPVTIDANAHVREAAKLMLEHKVGCLPVLKDGKLAGILTESDFVGLFARRDD